MLECRNATRDNISAMLLDERLPMKCKGMLCMLADGNLDPSLEAFRASASDGISAIMTAIGTLEESGYLVRERMRDDHGRYTKYRWIVDFERHE